MGIVHKTAQSDVLFAAKFSVTAIAISTFLTLPARSFTTDFWLLTLPWSAGPLLAVFVFRRGNKRSTPLPFIRSWKDLICIPLLLAAPAAYIIPSWLVSLVLVGSWPSGLTNFLQFDVISPKIVFCIMIGVACEEFAWRSFLHDAFDKQTYWGFGLTGIIWSIWHLPALLTGSYPTSHPALLAVIAFSLSLVLLSVIYGIVTKYFKCWGYAWILHCGHNMIHIIGWAAISKMPGNISPLASETGVAQPVVLAIVTVALCSIYKGKGSKNEYSDKAR